MIFEIKIAEKRRKYDLPETIYAVHLKEMFPNKKFQTAEEVHKTVSKKGFKTPSRNQAAYLQKLLNPIEIKSGEPLEGLKILNLNNIEGRKEETEEEEEEVFFGNPDIFVIDHDENGRYLQGWSNKTLSKCFDPGLFVFLKLN